MSDTKAITPEQMRSEIDMYARAVQAAFERQKRVGSGPHSHFLNWKQAWEEAIKLLENHEEEMPAEMREWVVENFYAQLRQIAKSPD